MATITGFTAEFIQAVLDGTIEDANVVGDDLIFTRKDGTTFNAGTVRGPEGIQGLTGPTSIEIVTSVTRPASPAEGLFIYETDTDRFYSWNGTTWIERGLGVLFCTAATRPTGTALFAGRMIFETDTKRVYIYNGATWVYIRGGTDPVAARLWRNAAKSLTVGGVDIVPFDSEDYDNGDNAVIAAGANQGRYTSPITGLLSVNCRTAIIIASGGERFIGSIYVNAVERDRGADIVPGANRWAIPCSSVISVNAGDVIDYRISQVGGTSRALEVGQALCYMSIALA